LEVVPEALVCVSDMVQGLGPAFHDKVYPLLEPMLQSGLTAELIDTLSVICEHLPSQKLLVQTRLLEEATKVLGGESRPVIPEPEYIYSWAKKGERFSRNPSPFANDFATNLESILGVPGGFAINGPGINGILVPTPSQSFSGNMGLAVQSRTSMSLSKHAKTIRGSPVPTTPVTPNTPTTTHKSAVKSKKSSFFSLNLKTSTTSKTTTAPVSVGLAAIGLGLGLKNEDDSPSQSSNEIAIVSLRTLASLSIPPLSLLSIVQQSVLPYLLADDHLVRKEASISCAKMTSALIHTAKSRGPTADAVEDVVSRLLEVTVSDTSIQVRLATLKTLTKDFDFFLSRTHHVDSLMLLLADEYFDIRLEALALLGRLAGANPANVLPLVRAHLSRLLSQMKNSPDYRMVEEAATMLCEFMKFNRFHFLVKPVMSTVLESLPLHADVRATTAALETVGELSVVLQNEMTPYVDTLLPVIISNMFDSSSLKKQEVAIRTLGKFVKSTGMVVKPYLQYPQLLPKTLDLLCKNSSNKPFSFRMEILRMLGLVGALEPSRYTAIVTFLQQSMQKKVESTNNGNNGDNLDDCNKSDNCKKITSNALFPLPGSSVERDYRGSNNGDLNNKKEDSRERAESNVSFMEKNTFMAGSMERGKYVFFSIDYVLNTKLHCCFIRR
jgi:hypothetical protein